MARITFTDRLYRDITADYLGHRTTRSLRIGDYVMSTSSYDGATDWRRITEIGPLEGGIFSRGSFRRVTLESVGYGWDDQGAYRPRPRYETVRVWTDETVRLARPV